MAGIDLLASLSRPQTLHTPGQSVPLTLNDFLTQQRARDRAKLELQDLLKQEPEQNLQSVIPQVEQLTTQRFRSPNFLERLFAPLTALQQGVLNTGEAVGDLVEGDFLEALRGVGRAGGSIVSGLTFRGAEDVLDLFGARESVGEALAARDSIGTKKNLSSVFESTVRGRDISSEAAALFGGVRTNIDPEGGLLSEFSFGAEAGAPTSILQDIGTVGAELVTDPISFFGLGPAAKFRRVAKGAVDEGITRIARARLLTKNPEILAEFRRVGANPTISGGEALINLEGATARRFQDLLFRERSEVLRQALDDPEIFRLNLREFARSLPSDNPLRGRLEESIRLGDKVGVKSLVLGRNFREQAALGQRTAFFGPYGEVMRRVLSPVNGGNALTKAIDRNIFDGLTNLNRAFGGGAPAIRDGAVSAERLARGVGTGNDVDAIFEASKHISNLAQPSVVEKLTGKLTNILSRATYPVRKAFITDTESRAIASALAGTTSLEHMVGRAKNLYYQPVKDAVDGLVNHQLFTDDSASKLWRAVRSKLEDKTHVISTGDASLDEALGAVYQASDKFRKDLLKFQQQFGVDVSEFIGKVNGEDFLWWGRIESDDLVSLLRTNRRAKELWSSSRSTLGPQVEPRTAKGATTRTDDLERDLRKYFADGGVSLPDNFKFFTEDVGATAARSFDNAARAVVQTQLFDELIRTTSRTPENAVVQATIDRVYAGLGRAADAIRPILRPGRDKRAVREAVEKLSAQELFNAVTRALRKPKSEDLIRDISIAGGTKLTKKQKAVIARLEKALEVRARRGTPPPQTGEELEKLLSPNLKADLVAAAAEAAGLTAPKGYTDALTAMRKLPRRLLPSDIDSIVEFKLQHMPNEVLDEFAELAKRFEPANVNGFVKAVDTVNSFARGTILTSLPSISVDFYGNLFTSLFFAGNKNPNAIREALRFVAGNGDSVLLKKLRKGFGKFSTRAVKTQYGQMPYEEAAQRLIDAGLFGQSRGIAVEGKPEVVFGNLVTRNLRRIGKEGFAIREAQDNAFRLEHAMRRLEAGDTIEDAISGARKYFFDYNDVTKFEKGVARRLILFYTFAKKSIPLQLRAFFETPLRAKLFQLVAGASANQDPDAEQWVRGLTGHRIGVDDRGSPVLASLSGNIFDPARRMFTTEGDDVVEHSANLLMNIAKGSSPLVKLIAEGGMDRDFFTGGWIGLSEPGKRAVARGEQAADRAPTWMNHPLIREHAEALVGFQPRVNARGEVSGYTMDPQKRWLFENILSLSSWSRAVELLADIGADTDPRKTVLQSASPFLPATVRPLPSEQREKVLLRQIARFETELQERLDSLPGRPFRLEGGSLSGNNKTEKGQAIDREIKRITELARAQADALGLSGDDRADAINTTINRRMNEVYPDYGFYKEYLTRLRRAKQYLTRPEQVVEEYRAKLLEAESKAR